MGVQIPRREKYEKKLSPKQKFRAGVFTVIAAMRISNLQEDWAEWKAVGEELKAASMGAKGKAKQQSERRRASSGVEGRTTKMRGV